MPSTPKQNPVKGYTSKQQPDSPLQWMVPGIGTSANPEEFKDDAALNTVDSSDNGKANGDNPNMPTTLPFANGPEVRNNYR